MSNKIFRRSKVPGKGPSIAKGDQVSYLLNPVQGTGGRNFVMCHSLFNEKAKVG